MIQGAKILVTGASGEVALPLVRFLARENEVWGAARLVDPARRERVEAAGARAVSVDLAEGDLSVLPDDFDYLLHLAYYRGGNRDFDRAMQVNGEGTGRILQHCRKAKAALVMSANTVYAPRDDPHDLPKEDDPIGGSNVPWSPTSGTAKVAQEAVARFAARAFDLPVTIARLSTVYGMSPRFLPVTHMDMIVAGKEIVLRWDPNTHTPIHTDDICDQLAAMLGAASVPATIVNWGGDEVVSAQDWCRLAAEFAGVELNLRTQPVPNTTRTGGTDPTKRQGITGPNRSVFAERYRRLFDARHGGAA